MSSVVTFSLITGISRDGVVILDSFAQFPNPGDANALYIDRSDNKSYRWNGSVYVQVGDGAANTDGLPEGSSNLYYTTGRVRAEIGNHTAAPDPHGQYALDVDVDAKIEEAWVFQNYQVNNVDDAGSGVTYVGKAKTDGKWLIEKITETGEDLAKDYANESNNSGVTTFMSAWTSRATLTYGKIQTLTGL